MAGCISDNPVDKGDPEGLRRVAIWRWAIKPYGRDPVTGKLTGAGISEGRSYEDVAESIREHVFGGTGGKTNEWIADILSGRKTPFKPFVMKTWTTQRNRRVITQIAKSQTDAILREQKQGPLLSSLGKVLEIPRKVSVWEHSFPLGVIHPGDLVFQPRNMGLFWKNLVDVARYAYPGPGSKIGSFEVAPRTGARLDAIIEQKINVMKMDDLYDMALHGRLKVGDQSRVGNLGPSKIGSPTERAWDLIKTKRFELWKDEYLKGLKPNMTEDEKLDLAKYVADMANHATGTSTGTVNEGIPRQIKGAFFGPALTESKLSRVIGDPIKTAKTFLNMKNATPAERYIAQRRMSRSMQYLGTVTGFLAVNAGFNKYVQHVDDKDNVNFFDPTRADWMSFKTGGVEWSVPGLHTELKFLGTVLAISAQGAMSVAGINKASHGYGQVGELAKAGGQYALNKMVPGGQIMMELAMRHDWQGRPMTFLGAGPGTAKKPALSPLEYAASKAPIPFTGPIKFVYDELRAKGASAKDSVDMIRGLILAGMSQFGLHAKSDPATTPGKH